MSLELLEFLRELGRATAKDFHADPVIVLHGDTSVEDHNYHATRIPDGWKLVDHIHQNNGEGHSAEPYCIDVYEDSNGGKHEVLAGTFNFDDARIKQLF